MPHALAIETSGRLSSVAISEAGVVLAQESFEHGLKHAAEILPRIDALMKAVGWRPADLAEIYVSTGPGSFTGLRIGITLAKTLAFATNAKLVAVPSVQVLARNAPPEAREVIITLDAKRDQIFTARLHREGAGDDWTPSEPAHLDSLAAMISRSPRPVYLLGEGLPFHRKFIGENEAGVIETDPELWRARAEVVVQMGYLAARRGEFISPQSLIPLYIRKPEAEEKLEARRAADELKNFCHG